MNTQYIISISQRVREQAKMLPLTSFICLPLLSLSSHLYREGTGASLANHAMHVTYNEERACYEGLPEEWAHINQQFGIPLAQVGQLP